MVTSTPSAAEIREALDENPKMFEFMLADKLGISEAQVIAARVGHGAVRIDPNPGKLMPKVERLGEVMGLTRNQSCVIEKVGTYVNYKSGRRAMMVLNENIDLRIFPDKWHSAYAVDRNGTSAHGSLHSIRIFDAAGDAVHAIYLREDSDLEAWQNLKADLVLSDQSDTQNVIERAQPEAPIERPDMAEALRQEWQEMKDTHQFGGIMRRLKMNRLGAYRVIGAPYVRPLALGAVDEMLEAVRDKDIEVFFFVGNDGCIQIHTGPVQNLKKVEAYGDVWQNVLDPGFDLHLRVGNIAEVYAVEKPTSRGAALSVEAFDAAGRTILQAFPMGRDNRDFRAPWKEVVAELSPLVQEAAE